ncbi:MAG: hypothetical protein JNL10_08430 [Verrucomicrobiales bacterium]|nr:hypothetical protein [Verrucomicrobiales bacterium]
MSGLFSLERRYGWTAGELPTEGLGPTRGEVRRQSYWSARVTPEGVSSDDQQLEEALDRVASDVMRRSDALADFHATGGTLNVFVGLIGVGNFGLVMPIPLLQKLAAARIELQLDIYPQKS